VSLERFGVLELRQYTLFGGRRDELMRLFQREFVAPQNAVGARVKSVKLSPPGWRLDADFPFDNGVRIVQITPPGSPCSIQFGDKLTTAAPGSAENLYLVVADIDTAREALMARGAQVSEVFHPGAPGAQFQPDGAPDRLRGPAPDHESYRSFATFSDPDGNRWALQEVPPRP